MGSVVTADDGGRGQVDPAAGGFGTAPASGTGAKWEGFGQWDSGRGTDRAADPFWRAVGQSPRPRVDASTTLYGKGK